MLEISVAAVHDEFEKRVVSLGNVIYNLSPDEAGIDKTKLKV